MVIAYPFGTDKLRLMSEKMDGVRSYWDGSKLWSRHGKAISSPDWFTEELPKVALDGELWMGRGTFEELMTVLNSKETNDTKWKEIGYYLFDLPASNVTYKETVEQLERLKPLPSHAHIV